MITIYICLTCGFWKASSGIAEAFLKGFAQSGTLSVKHVCPDCNQDLYAVNPDDKLSVKRPAVLPDRDAEAVVSG